MGISLTGLTPATTYDALIKVGDNGPIDATLKVLSDGLGTNLPMEASTTGINFTGNLTQSGTALQPVLVSGTNIKTINSTSILGSGNISVVTSPSGVAGAIQFSDGSAFASDATKFFWDNTNKRLGIGTNTPNSLLNVIGTGGVAGIRVNTSGADSWMPFSDGNWYVRSNGVIINDNNTAGVSIGINSPTTARLMVKGSGSTSATTSLLVQNSAGTERFKIQDDGTTTFNGGVTGTGITISPDGSLTQNNNATGITAAYDGGLKLSGGVGLFVRNATGYNKTLLQGGYDGGLRFSANPSASDFINLRNDTTALLEMESTTKGFLPPRGTNTQMNAIASPATGLVFYDTTNNKLCVYNATSWIPLH
jgi:hypothetical protein